MTHDSTELPGDVSVDVPGGIPPFPDISRRFQSIQSMVVDYALGVAIVGLNPFQNLLTLTLCIAAAINLKMIWDITRMWRFPQKRSILAIASFGFNLLGALSMGLMAWISFTVAGLFFPIFNRFALSAALMTLTWILGAVVNQFLLQGCLHHHAKHHHAR